MSSRQFLNTKSYHPGRKENQKKLWEAEQAESRKRHEDEARRQELQRERVREANLFESGTGDMEAIRARESVSFMYRAPPGYYRDRDKEKADLAKAKQDNPALLTFEDKFPEARGAPVISQAAKPAAMRVNMLGKVLRNVQCRKCGVWGHKSGERECLMRDVVGQSDMERRDREDPVRCFTDVPAPASKSGVVLKEEITIRGGCDAASENQQLLSCLPEEEEEERKFSCVSVADANHVDDTDDPEVSYVRSLTSDERHTLLKKLKKESKERKAEKRKLKASRKDASEKHRRRSHSAERSLPSPDKHRKRHRSPEPSSRHSGKHRRRSRNPDDTYRDTKHSSR